MSGVKGMRGGGGARPNTGGARPGAGRPKKERPEPTKVEGNDPLEYLLGVMRGEIDATALQVRAAVAAAQYVHTKLHDGGKKDAKDAAAQKAASKFAPSAAPPRLVSSR